MKKETPGKARKPLTPADYLKKILTARVYDVAVESALGEEHAASSSSPRGASDLGAVIGCSATVDCLSLHPPESGVNNAACPET